MFDFNTLPGLFKHIQENIKTPSYLNYRNGATFERVSSDEFVSRVIQLTNAFHKIGVKRGTTVAIISPSSPFWLKPEAINPKQPKFWASTARPCTRKSTSSKFSPDSIAP